MNLSSKSLQYEVPGNSWKILIVDDEVEIHDVTKLALRRYSFDQKGLEYLSAYSAIEARQILKQNSNIAIVLLDVIMETGDAGLTLAQYIREDLENSLTRIILRTGQPDEVPENTIILKYDINDYRTKTELTQTRLITTVTAALRTYKAIWTLEQQSQALLHLSHQLRYQANHDELTKLVNRREFERRLSRAIESSRELGVEHALCYIDLDQFRVVNDTFGHIAGDELLRQLGSMLRELISESDTVARVGGDEFVILMEKRSFQQARGFAGTVLQRIKDFRFNWEGKTLQVEASLGLVPIDGASEGVISVLRAADNLCYIAKECGGNRVYEYTLNDSELEQRREEFQNFIQLNDAFENSKFKLYYQSIVPINRNSHQSCQYEILIRMHSDDGTIILPGMFLGTAEKYNLSLKLDQWVINQIFKGFESNSKLFDGITFISVNLSRSALTDETFKKELIAKLVSSKIPSEKICFDITETTATTDFTRVLEFIQEVKAQGCRVALDDFGTGFCSFAYLKHLPIDYIKIDEIFIRSILYSPIDETLVKSINDISHSMGKQTIAECVDSSQIIDKLVEIGVDYAQGYAISRPKPLEIFDSDDSILGDHLRE